MLFWGKPSYLKEGRGVAKDEPPKTGLRLFCDRLSCEFWQLLKLNLIFILCALPLVTFGAARAALSKCTMRMARGALDSAVWYDFRKAFRQDFIRNTLFGCLELFYIGCLLLAARAGIPQTFLFVGIIGAGLFFPYAWSILVMIDIPAGAAMKNAIILSAACVRHSVPMLIGTLLLLCSMFAFFPVSLPALLFLPFGLSSFLQSFIIWADIQKYICKGAVK